MLYLYDDSIHPKLCCVHYPEVFSDIYAQVRTTNSCRKLNQIENNHYQSV